MLLPQPEDGLQPAALAVYTLLTGLRRNWGGNIVLSQRLHAQGQAVALAGIAAGAVCLSIDPDPAACRAAMRLGVCDFLVKTLDEALRVIKNEVRQGRPLSVALELDTNEAFTELLERGVLPRLLVVASDGRTHPAILRYLEGMKPHGMAVLDLDMPSTLLDLRVLLNEHSQGFHTLSFATLAEMKAADARLQEGIPRDDPRQLWLLAAPRLFHRERPLRRSVLLTQQEVAALC